MSALEKNPEVLASNSDEDLGHSPIRQESREAPRIWHGDLTFLSQSVGVPEVPFVTLEEPQGSRRNSRKTRRFSPQCNMRILSAATSREKATDPYVNSTGSLTVL